MGRWLGFGQSKRQKRVEQVEIKNRENARKAAEKKGLEKYRFRGETYKTDDKQFLEKLIVPKEQKQENTNILPETTISQTNNASGGNATSTANTTTTTNNVSNDAKETNALLKTLIGEVKKGNTIYIDGKMVGQSIAQTQSKLG